MVVSRLGRLFKIVSRPMRIRMVFRGSLMASMELIPLERLHALNAARYRLYVLLAYSPVDL